MVYMQYYNSCTNCPELAQTLQVMRTVPNKTALKLDTSHQFRGLQCTSIWPNSPTFQDSHNSVRFYNSVEQCTELRKLPCFQLPFYYQGFRLGPARWRHWQESRGISDVELFSLHPAESEHILLLTHQCDHQPEKHDEFWCPELLWDPII